jgi:hypothetical protein
VGHATAAEVTAAAAAAATTAATLRLAGQWSSKGQNENTNSRKEEL